MRFRYSQGRAQNTLQSCDNAFRWLVAGAFALVAADCASMALRLSHDFTASPRKQAPRFTAQLSRDTGNTPPPLG